MYDVPPLYQSGDPAKRTSGSAAGVSVLHVNTTAVGNVLAGEDDLMTYVLPANKLDANGKALRIRAWGTTSASVTTYKRRRLYFGAVRLHDATAAIDATSTWEIIATVVRTGASAQEAYIASLAAGAAGGGATVHVDPASLSEVLSGAVTIRVTGESIPKAADPALTNDIIQRGLIVELLP